MTITDEMVERAARKMHEMTHDGSHGLLRPFDEIPTDTLAEIKNGVREVLTAALGETHVVVPREPTQAMSVDGGLAIEEAMFNSDKLVFDGAADCYRAMDIVDRLKDACVGHPAAEIPWPHRLLHDAISEIDRLRNWSRIDKELSAYMQEAREKAFEECAKIAESRPTSHAEWCIADPDAVRKNAADRIRAALSGQER